MHKPAAGTQDANIAVFPCTCFLSPGRPLSLGGWGAHHSGFYNTVPQIYQGFSIESHRLILFHGAMLVLLCFLLIESLG